MSNEQEQHQDPTTNPSSTQEQAQDASLIEQLPDNKQRLHPDSIKVSRITTAIVSLIIMLLPSVAGILSETYLLLAIGVGVGLLIFTIGFIWARKSYDYTWYWLADEGLYIQRGVWWRKKTLVPFNRVQHTDVAQGPLERKYKLGKLVTHTAGTRDASVSLEGILLDTAHELRSVLQEEGESDAV
ncbi:PH domain-containing protein [Kangiella sp. M94]